MAPTSWPSPKRGSVLITALPVAGLMGTPSPVSLTLIAPSEVHRLDLEYDTGIR